MDFSGKKKINKIKSVGLKSFHSLGTRIYFFPASFYFVSLLGMGFGSEKKLKRRRKQLIIAVTKQTRLVRSENFTFADLKNRSCSTATAKTQ